MGRTHRDHIKCCCSDASYIPQHPHQSMKDLSMTYIQIEGMTKNKGIANDCVTGERVRLFLREHPRLLSK